MLDGKKVLVTGAGGFIGSHLTETLAARGAEVRAFVRYNGRSDPGMLADLAPETQRKLEIVFGDISDPFAVRRAVRGCDYVFHLAALIGIPYSYAAPADYVRVNVEGTLNVLQACRDEGTTRVVHTSTSEAYGTALYVPIDESHALQAQSPYSASKIGADKMAESYHLSFGLPVVTIRPFNTFGPRQSARAFIPTVISQALTRDRIQVGSLDPIRDLTYVSDTVEGMLTLGLHDAAVGQVFNLGTGTGPTMGDVVTAILKLVGKPHLKVEHDPGRARPPQSEVMRLVSDNRKALALGWKPRFTLEQGLEATLPWIARNLERYRPDTYAV